MEGYQGPFSLLCETGAHPCNVQQAVNLEILKSACPDIVAISCDPNYDKSRNRLGIMEMSLEDFWRVELDDIARFKPDGVWWFGSGCAVGTEGAHVSAARLRQSGYKDGRDARRAFLRALAKRLVHTSAIRAGR
jgi:hypothetical protein